MLLAIDAGNTNVVFAVYDGQAIRAQWRAVTKVSRTSDEYAVWLSQLLALEGLSLKDLDAAIIAVPTFAHLAIASTCLSRPRSSCFAAMAAAAASAATASAASWRSAERQNSGFQK